MDTQNKDYVIEKGTIRGTNNKLTRIEIPDGVTSIDDDAFKDYKNLMEVIIPDSVSYIGKSAFENCTALTEIVLPRALSEINSSLFRGCNRLEKVTIPDKVTSIGYNAFHECKKLKNVKIPEAVTEIEFFAFYGCQALTQIEIPEGVDTLDDYTFGDCTSLVSIRLPSTLTTINASAFASCKSLKEVDIPDGVTEIGDSAFEECSSLTGIVIPDSVTSVGDFAFDGCDALKTVSMPGNNVAVGEYAFPDGAEIIYRSGNGRTSKRKSDSNSTSVSEKKTVGKYSAVLPSDELYSHYGKLKREAEKFMGIGIRVVQNNGEEFQALDIMEILEHNGQMKTNVYKKLEAAMSVDDYDLDEIALKIAQIFRVNESMFNSRHDDEGDIHDKLMDKKWKLSALRSFAWTLADLADREKKSIDDYDYDDLAALCSFIEGREWLNYEGGSWFDALCGHPDIHVFYMPGAMVEKGEADEICTVLKYDPIVSLDAFRNDLLLLKNVMIKLHNGLLESRDRNVKLDTPVSAVLQAWCVMAVSAETPFVSEDGPMLYFHSYRNDALNTKPIPVGKKAATVTKAMPKQKTLGASASGMENIASYEIVKGADGKERVKLGEYPAGAPITWLVLEKKGQELLLLSELALDAKPFSQASFGTETTNEWNESSLRTWMNSEFYSEAFSDEEREMILDDTHDTYKKSSNGEEETLPATDKVFLLSAREVKKYYPQDRDRICKASAYAKQRGAEIEGGPNQCSWWLRSPAVTMMGLPTWASSIRADGSGKGWGIFSEEVCVRPVIRVKSSKFVFSGIQANSAAEAKSSGVAAGSAGRRGTKAKQVTELKGSAGGTVSQQAQTLDQPLSDEVKNELENAQNILAEMRSQISSANAVLEAQRERLRKQEEKKQRQIEEAKKKGKSSHDEVSMLAVLLVEEALGKLKRSEKEFIQIYAGDFAAYNKQDLGRLRKKVMPTIHDADAVESAKADMLSRSMEDRLSISTANYFNSGLEWDFDTRADAAIEATKQWYTETEIPQLRKRLEEYGETIRQDVFRQLSAIRAEWTDFKKLRGDIQVTISADDTTPVPENHNLFHAKVGYKSDVDVQINLTNPAVGYLSVPVMNVFAPCWKVSPKEIWDAALQNEISDGRGASGKTMEDALAARDKALRHLGKISTVPKATTKKPAAKANQKRSASTPENSNTPVSCSASKDNSSAIKSNTAEKSVASAKTSTPVNSSVPAVNPIAKRIRELEESIAALQREADSIGGLFGFIKRNKIKKEIEAQRSEIERLKS